MSATEAQLGLAYEFEFEFEFDLKFDNGFRVRVSSSSFCVQDSGFEFRIPFWGSVFGPFSGPFGDPFSVPLGTHFRVHLGTHLGTENDHLRELVDYQHSVRGIAPPTIEDLSLRLTMH